MNRAFTIVPTPNGGVSIKGSMAGFKEHLRLNPELGAIYFGKREAQCTNQDAESVNDQNSSTPSATTESPVSQETSYAVADTTRASWAGPTRGRRKQDERVFKVSPSSKMISKYRSIHRKFRNKVYKGSFSDKIPAEKVRAVVEHIDVYGRTLNSQRTWEIRDLEGDEAEVDEVGPLVCSLCNKWS